MNKSVKIVNILEKLRPLDNVFLRELFRDYPPFTEDIIGIVTGKTGMKIIEQVSDTADNSVCLEAIGRDCRGKEIRYIIVSDNSGESFNISEYTPVLSASGKDLPSYIIFFDEKDFKGKNKPVYDLGRADGNNHIIRVNGAYSREGDNSIIAMLIRDFNRSDPKEMELCLLCLRVSDYKYSPDGINRMRNLIVKNYENELKE